MNTLALKWIALLSMTTDHLVYVLYQNEWISESFYLIGRCLGRLAFPIYLYLLLIGFYKTHNRLQYFLRLLCFAVLSEIPYNLFRNGTISFFKEQNVFFLLCTAFLLYRYLQKIEEQKWKIILQSLISIIVIIVFAFWSSILRFDYGWFGILLAAVFYYAHKQKDKTKSGFIFLTGMSIILPFEMAFHNVMAIFILFAIPLFLFTKEKKIVVPKPVRLLFYLYYPVHLIWLRVLLK